MVSQPIQIKHTKLSVRIFQLKNFYLVALYNKFFIHVAVFSCVELILKHDSIMNSGVNIFEITALLCKNDIFQQLWNSCSMTVYYISVVK